MSGGARHAGVASVEPAQTSADGRWVRVDAVLADPPETDAALATVRASARRCGAYPAPTPWWAARPRRSSTPSARPGRDDRVVIPLILGVVLL